jgi:hypothetical protein
VFEIVGDITNVQVIATGRGIRRLKTLRSPIEITPSTLMALGASVSLILTVSTVAK